MSTGKEQMKSAEEQQKISREKVRRKQQSWYCKVGPPPIYQQRGEKMCVS